VPAMKRKKKVPFDPKVFLSKVNGGRTVTDYRKNQIVYTQGEPSDSVFYIQSGKVKKTVVSEQGKEAVVALLGTGVFFWRRVLDRRAAASGARLGWPFEEGDSLHPESNIAKMHAGIPLTDADRLPWLQRVAAWIDEQRSKKQPGIITCSALKQTYRQIIVGDRPEVRLVYLRGGRDLIAEHLAGRPAISCRQHCCEARSTLSKSRTRARIR
jgi:Cyclic nucleotide-binding domain